MMQDVVAELEAKGKREGIITHFEIREAVIGAGLRKEETVLVRAELEDRGIKVLNESAPEDSELKIIENGTAHGKRGRRRKKKAV